MTSYYGKFAIEVLPSQPNQTAHHKQTDQIEYRTLNGFHRIHKNIQIQNSQRAKSIVTNDVFSIIYKNISILEFKKTTSELPPQTSRHSTVRQKNLSFLEISRYNP